MITEGGQSATCQRFFSLWNAPLKTFKEWSSQCGFNEPYSKIFLIFYFKCYTEFSTVHQIIIIIIDFLCSNA